MITGDSKQGKKTLVNYLARRFSQGKYSQYIPVDLLSPDHWFQLLPNERHLVILDDFLGGSESTDTYWRRVLEQILDQVEEGNVVLIMSCQDVKKSEYIQKQLEPHIFDESFLVDLVSDRFQIKQFEQVSILGKMFQKHKIIVSKKELACICEQGIPSAFFACCEYFTKHVKTQNLTTNFFRNPWQMFLPKIRSYLQENKPLFFTLLREGLADVVDISPELAEDISTYAKERSQFPDFFSTGNESLKFKHKCFRICIFLALYDLDPKMMVRICPLDILVEYTTTKQKNQDGKLKISQDNYHDLSKRFQGHLETDLELTLSHDYFLDCQLLSQGIVASLRLINPVLLIRHAIRCGTTGLVKFCLTDRDLDDGYQENMHELLHESLESLNFEISNFILERGERFCDLCFLHVCKSQKKLKNPSIDLQLELHDIEGLPTNVLKLSFEELFTRGYTDAIMYIISRLEHRRDFPDLREFLINESCKYGHQNVYFCLKPKLDFFPSRDTLLSYASEGGCCEIVDDLLQMGADPNYMAHPVYTSLHLASKGNRFSIAEKLLEYGAEIKTVSKQKENVLHLASNVSKGIPPKLLIWFLREFSDMVSIYSKDAYGRTPLHIASASGNILAIKQLIGAGGHVSAHDSGGNTPLHCLVMGDNPDPETINYLVEKGADIDARNGNGETALQQLVKKGKGDDRCEVLHYMISKTKELDSFDNNGEFLLHSLLSHGCNFEEAEILIEGGCSVNARDIEDNTVLHLLASLGNERLTKVAIEKGASLLARNVKGETTLHRAVCVPNNMPVVELLMTGCQESLVAVDKFDNTPLHSACSVSVEQSELYISRLTESQPCLVNKGNYQKRTALHLAAASNGDSALTNVGLLLQADANMSKDVFDSLPLHLTCLSCGPLSPQIIQVLQMHGADVNVQNRKGNLPLHEALVSEGPNKENVVISLICYKSKLLSTNNEGLTPVDLAINNGDLEIAMTLTNAVISAACRSRHYNGHELLRLMRHVEFLDRNNESLLHKVCEISGKYTSELIKELVQNGCKVNIKDTNGRTPLHVACKMAGKHSVGIVKQLLAQGADANDKDNDRNNALHFACTAKSDQTPAIVQILYDNKASVDERSRDGDTPLHKACKLGGSELSSLIKALMNCGADMEIYNECGLRPLDIIQQLSDAPDILGVLHSAKLLNLCSRGVELNESKTRYLLKQGASLDYTNRDGDTCLHEICKQNGKYTVKNAQLLLSLGADPHAQNNNELTPYDLAVFSGNYKVSEIVHEKQQTTEIKRTKSSPREKVRPIDTISKVINIIDESYTTSQKIVKKAGEACADEDEDLNEIVKLAGTSLKFGKKLTKGGKKVTEFFERFFEEDNSD